MNMVKHRRVATVSIVTTTLLLLCMIATQSSNYHVSGQQFLSSPDVIWDYQTGTSGREYGASVAYHDGYIYALHAWNGDLAVSKISSSGSFQWRVVPDPSAWPTAIVAASNGYIYAVGSCIGSCASTGGSTQSNSNDSYMVKISMTSGAVAWEYQFGVGNLDYYKVVAVDSSGNAYGAGYQVFDYNNYKLDTMIHKISNSGVKGWQHRIYSTSSDSAAGLVVAGSYLYSCGNAGASLVGGSTIGAGTGGYVGKHPLSSGGNTWLIQGAFVSCLCMSKDSNNNLIIASKGSLNDRASTNLYLTRMSSSDGAIISQVASQSSTLQGASYGIVNMALDSNNNVYVVGNINSDYSLALAYTSDLQIVSTWVAGASGGVSNADGVAIDLSTNNVYIIGDTKYAQFGSYSGDTDFWAVQKNVDPSQISNAAPVANDDSYSISGTGGSVNIYPLLNDTDADGNSLSVLSITETPTYGTLVTNSNGDYTFTAFSSANDVTETLTYTVSDGVTYSTGQISISIANNQAPVAISDHYTIDSVQGSVIVLPLDNDSDADGNTLAVTAIDSPQYGALVTNSDGNYTYTASENVRSAVETLSYTVSDGELTQVGTITITIDIKATNRPALPWTYRSVRCESNPSNYCLDIGHDFAFDVLFDVTFPNSVALQDNAIELSSGGGYCDFTSTDPTANDGIWSYVTGSAESELNMTISAADMLGKCGFVQDLNDRGDGKIHFVQTVTISGVQTRENAIRQEYNVTRSSQFIIDIAILPNVTAVVDSIDVYGTAFVLDLLGDMQVDISATADPTSNYDYDYIVNGQLVTSTQYPYHMEGPVYSFDTDVFNASTWSMSPDTYCANNAPECVQTWSFSVNLRSDVACISRTELTNDLINITFQVNCSEMFDGECAPDFATDPAVTIVLSSPDMCPSVSNVSLSSTLDLYAYVGADTSVPAPVSGTSSFFSTSQDAPPSEFRNEGIFVFESSVFGEANVLVSGNAATLATTTILSITTDPAGYAAKEIYSFDPDTQQEEKSDSSIAVNHDSFGTGTYPDSRARFSFPWNSNTLNRAASSESNGDDAETVSVSVFLLVTFVEASSIDESPIVRQLSYADRVKSTRTTVSYELLADGQTASSSARAIASVQSGTAGSPGAAPSAANGSSGLLAGNTVVIGVVVAGCVVVALVVLSINRNRRTTRPPAKTVGEADDDTMSSQCHGHLTHVIGTACDSDSAAAAFNLAHSSSSSSFTSPGPVTVPVGVELIQMPYIGNSALHDLQLVPSPLVDVAYAYDVNSTSTSSSQQ
jgi:VCBS repeat-containing protein